MDSFGPLNYSSKNIALKKNPSQIIHIHSCPKHVVPTHHFRGLPSRLLLSFAKMLCGLKNQQYTALVPSAVCYNLKAFLVGFTFREQRACGAFSSCGKRFHSGQLRSSLKAPPADRGAEPHLLFLRRPADDLAVSVMSGLCDDPNGTKNYGRQKITTHSKGRIVPN